MRYLLRIFKPFIGLSLVLVFPLWVFSQQAVVGNSTISGSVYDKNRNAYADLDVELLNDYYQSIRRTRTDGIGRYEFAGLSDGRYTVKVYAFRYDLEDQSQQTEIDTITITGTQGSTFITLDFVLLPKKGGLADSELGVVFAQDVPKEAKKLYEGALADFGAKKAKEGILKLNEAIKIFPDYFPALYRIGKELLIIKQYEDAARFFIRATEVNPKSANSFYYLGHCLQNMGKDFNKAAIVSFNQAALLAPTSVQVLFSLGKAERSEKNFANAEKYLLQAKKMGKGHAEVHKELAELYGNDLKKYSLAADELELYMKSSKASKQEEAKMKKMISDLREKAKQLGS